MPTDTPEQLAEAFAAAISAGEVPAAVALWNDDAAIVQPDGQSIHGRPAIGDALQALVDNGLAMEIDVTGVFQAGDVATVIGTLTLSGANGDGEPFTQRSSSVVVYTRGPEGWRIALDAPWGLPSV
ncbi:MAG TPA: nuclear transport factor 2 family protein [Solirubrobacteraceae bacterium]|nr:nuclear transport factor 2 family protein [Solirubrobacteraceae bacterium]